MDQHRRGILSLALAAVLFSSVFSAYARAEVLTSADVIVQGASLTVVTTTATVQLGSPALIQTAFANKTNNEAPIIDGALALGDLIGPGITTPVTVSTPPGHAFVVAGFTAEGVYYLQNIRLVGRSGNVLQTASPSFAVIQVTNALKTNVTVRQLTADELRARGITVDPSNYDVFEYSFSFLVDGKTVVIPYPVIINRTTHEVQPVERETPYVLPDDQAQAPPRWSPPASVVFDFDAPDGLSDMMQGAPDVEDQLPPRPQIHAAIVIPNSLAVLHQFFAVALVVTNGAPAGSGVTLNSIRATIDAPNQLRVVKSEPPVSFGQPVAISGPNGAAFLVAQAQGNAEWTLEGLKPGTYTVKLDIDATFKSPGQPDVALAAHPSASIVVHDARFNITFSHPDVVNKNAPYTAYTFITNTSESAQDITLSDGGLPPCTPDRDQYPKNVCRVEGPASASVHLEAGETKSVPYRLKSGINGHVFATAVSIDGSDSAITSASFVLDMGVNAAGVPLSPVTLILPYYARTPYFSQEYLDAQLGLFGIGYGLATAPLTKATAKFPRLITSDVFTRAIDLARAGERMFLGEDRRAALANLSLDLLGNAAPLAEWDQFGRTELADSADVIAHDASKAMATELTAAFAGGDGRLSDLVEQFANATSYRTPYVLAFAHGSGTGTRPYGVRITAADNHVLDGSAGMWQIPFGDAWSLAAPNDKGELAVAGRASGAYDVTVTPSAGGTLDLVFPSADGKSLVRATGTFSGAPVNVHIANGAATSTEIALTSTAVVIPPVRIVGARQDLHLDPDGHVVSVLVNRVLPPASGDLKGSFDTDVTLDATKYGVTFSGKRTVAGAALQPDGRIIRLAYDGALSNDAQYTIHTSGIVDAGSAANVVPVIENRNSALLYGSVIGGDNQPIAGADLTLSTPTGIQYSTSDASGRYLFEYVPRDPDNGINGAYQLRANAGGREAKVDGSVRLLHTVHQVNVSFLGRGAARGVVRYDNGDPAANAAVVVGSTMFNAFRTATTAADGSYKVNDVPVGPLTFSAQDSAGNIAFAANELRAGGEVAVQDISIFRRPNPGTATVTGRIVRSDNHAAVPGTHVGVYTQGYGLRDAFTDAAGRFEFTKVPSGFVTVLAENYQVAPEALAIDFDLKSDTVYDAGDLVLAIRDNDPLVSVEGDVTIEDAVTHAFSAVANAAVQIDGMSVIAADAAGHYRYAAVPQSFTGRRIRAYDAKTGRIGTNVLPALSAAATNGVPITLLAANGSGTGTVRVHLVSASGDPVTGYHVFEPGFPRLESVPGDGPGVYEFRNISAGRTLLAVAAPLAGNDARYGSQFTSGEAKVSFAGQIGAVTLRLPGQGSVRARIQQQTSTGVPVQLAGRVHVTFTKWSDVEQEPVPVVLEGTTDGASDAVIANVPALRDVRLETFESSGYAATTLRINFDGDSQTRTLTLSTQSAVSGRVLATDGVTPVAGAAVHLVDSAQDFGSIPSALDGSFAFTNVTPLSAFTVTADFSENGIYRTARVTGSTPGNGVPVGNVTLVLLKQGSVEGRIVNGSGAAIPFAKFWLRELDYPGRSFGAAGSPLVADASGRFRINNVFAVPVRVTAEDPNNPDLRGDWNGAVVAEGDVQTPTIVIGGAGSGTVKITVEDPNRGYAPVPNAEVSLYRGGSLFDFATTDITGAVTFESVPVQDGYTASAFSKSLGSFGATSPFAVARNVTALEHIALAVSGRVQGTVTDPQASGAAVPGADVTLFGSDYQTRSTTGSDGAFDFLGIREGSIRLEARDPLSIRMAKSAGVVSLDKPSIIVPLTLEPTSTLSVKAFLPNDAGGSSGTLAPQVSIDVKMTAPGGEYLRSSQVNSSQFAGMVRGAGYTVEVQELGGLHRFARRTGSFGPGVAAQEEQIVFSAAGSVVAHVVKGNPAVAAAEVLVTASSAGVSVSGYTDASGKVTLSGVSLGTVSLQATTSGSLPLTGATSVSLTSQSVAAEAPVITLGSYNAVAGYVEAEAGGPSAETRVVAQYNGLQLETRTDVTGHFKIQGIATGTSGVSVVLTYLGPDDQTIGFRQTVELPNGSGVVTAPNARLDSTPPRVVAIAPADGSAGTAPDSSIIVTFSRTMNLATLQSGGAVRLFDVGTNAEVPLTLQSATVQPDKTQVVIYSPPAPPAGQAFALKSKALYRVEVSANVEDTAAHKLGVTVGASFTTSDYSNPQVVKVTPSPAVPLPKQGLRFAVTFSKALAAAPWQAGGSGVMQLVRIDRLGGVSIGVPIAGTVQLDASATVLYFGPNAVLAPASFYRLSIAGAVDTSGRGLVDAAGQPLAVWSQDFRTADEVAPVVTIGTPRLGATPIGATDPLFAGVLYSFPVTLANPDGSAVTDLDEADFYSVDAGGAATKINHTQPLSADVAIPAGASFTLRVVARDLSGNVSAPADLTWSVQSVPALAINATSVTPAIVYAGQTFTDTVTLSGGKLSADVAVRAYVNGAATPAASAQTTVTRASFTAPWPNAVLQLALPAATPSNASIVLTATASDDRGTVTRNDTLALSADTNVPAVTGLAVEVVRSSTPSNSSVFHNGDQYRLHAFAKDDETGVASVTFNAGGTTFVVSSGTYRAATGMAEFVSPVITVQSHNEDFTLTVTAEAADYAANKALTGTSLTYLGIHDPTAPTVAWISPLNGAAWPASTSGFTTRLSVYAVSQKTLSARFAVTGGGTFTGVRNGNQFDADVTLDTPAAGGALTITAHVDDGDGGHVIELPITIDFVATTQRIGAGQTVAVDATRPLTGDSVLVDGGRLVTHVPLALKNLVVLSGGIVESGFSTTTSDERVALTIADHVFVDGRSSIDVARRGYLGGLEANADGTGSNSDPRGMTAGHTPIGGASSGASASYAGVGGDDRTFATNATYGSIATPSDLGSGGAADSSNRRGGQGGGSMTLAATSGLGKVAVAGTISADGESGVGQGGAGSGGSLHISGKTVSIGALASLTANGGDDDASSNGGTRGGGGGRISVEASTQLGIDTTAGVRLYAHGGRNLASDTNAFSDGGAGTIFLRYPGEAGGELLVTSDDSRYAGTAHLALPTPVAGVQTFDRVTAGGAALVRFDGNVTVAGVSNDRAAMTTGSNAIVVLAADVPALSVTTTPAAGGSLIQNTNLSLNYTAASVSGISSVVATLDPSLATKSDVVAVPATPVTASATLLVPPAATPGSTATLHVRATDRAGRSIDAAAQTYTIVANAAPVITTFDVTSPSPLYIGGSINAAITATDDLAVTSLGLMTQIGSGAPATQAFTTSGTPASKTFTVAIPSDAALDAQTVTLTAIANDGYPNRTTTVVKTVTIAHDGNPPSVSITQPAAGALFNEGATNLIHLTGSVADGESGVASVSATIAGGETVTLTVNGGTYSGDIHVPSVPDGADVQRTITVTARDVTGNPSSATVAVMIHPLYDPTAPVASWGCGSDGAAFPTDYSTTLSVTVVPGASGTAIDTVTFFDGTTSRLATRNGNVYSINYTAPATAGVVTMTVTAKSLGGGTKDLVGTIRIVAIDKTINSDVTINDGDATYDLQHVSITGGTTTIVGHHEFKSLLVLGGGTLTHPPISSVGSARLDVKAETFYVACSGVVQLTGRGYAIGTSYPGATAASANNGGSHMGVGGTASGTPATTFGSVYRPQEAGGGAGNGTAGGGILRVDATSSFAVDGSIQVHGLATDSYGSGAGGSIWITARKVGGSGTVQADGGGTYSGYDFRAGGGGAIAVEYTDRTSVLPILYARASYGIGGGAGTIYVKGPDSVYGDLTVENNGKSADVTDLPSLGSGTAQSGTSGATLVTDRQVNIPAYFAGHWIEIRDAAGTLKGTWRVATVVPNSKTVTLAPNGAEVVSLVPGDRWQGVYLFDVLHTSAGGALRSADPIRVTTVDASGTGAQMQTPITATTVRISGSVAASQLTTSDLTVASGAELTQAGSSLTIAAQTVTVDGTISAKGRGYSEQSTYPGATTAIANNGGSHMGIGGVGHGSGATTFGSVDGPQEAGGGASGGRGGGVVRITATSLVVNGAIRASGADLSAYGAGAGGSVWITAGRITGSGLVEANGGNTVRQGDFGAGGGGAVAVEYTDASSVLPAISAAAGGVGGGPGTVWIKRPGSVYGDLTVDTAGKVPNDLTVLPSLGSGVVTAASGATLTTDQSTDIPPYFAGHFVDVVGANGVVRGTWRIKTVTGKSVTLSPNGSETLVVQAADTWRGVYRFDSITVRSGASLNSADRVDVTGSISKDSSSVVLLNSAAPAVTQSKISVTSSSAGDAVVGTAGAATDADQPVKITVTNTRSGATFTGTAAADGSFTVPVTALTGDTFTLKATDSHTFPLWTMATVPGTVSAPPVVSVTLSSNTVTGGGSVTGTATLLHPLPSSVAVTLASSSTYALVPASVTVPAGSATSNPFTITTTAPPSATPATITATYANSSATAVLTVNPATASLATIALSNPTPLAGTIVTATVTMSGSAATDAVVLLSSSDSIVASTPASVTVAAGATTATAQIGVEHAGPATITAAFGAQTAAVNLVASGCSSPTAAAPAALPLDQLWIDSDPSFVTGQAASGTTALRLAHAAGMHAAPVLHGGSDLAVSSTDNLVVYAMIDPCYPPREIQLTWRDAALNAYVATWGEDLVDAQSPHVRIGTMPAAGQWVRLEVPVTAIGATSPLTSVQVTLYDGEAWFDAFGRKSATLTSAVAAPSLPANETVWFDDALPPGAVVDTGSGGTTFHWDSLQRASGSVSNELPAHTGWLQNYFYFANPTFPVQAGDVFFVYALLDPANPPREVLFQWWEAAGWSHRAVWGQILDTVITSDHAAAFHMGPVPAAGSWARLEIPSYNIGLEGVNVGGIALGTNNGHAWFDRVGKYSRTNLAFGKPATQSSTHDADVASRAVDGNTNGNWSAGSVTHTLLDSRGWWQVDLGSSRAIDAVEVWNRTDCCGDRLTNFWLIISDTDLGASTDIAAMTAQPGVKAYHWTAAVGANLYFDTKTAGRYVRVQLDGTNYLSLAEVQVFAPGAAARADLAGGRPAAQISNLSSGTTAASALDCQMESFAQFAATAGLGPNDWWETDLGSSQSISSIDLFNRLDASAPPLTNLYVLISDQPFASHDLSETLRQAGVYVVYAGPPSLRAASVPINRTGRYIRVQKSGSGALGLGEVRVWSGDKLLVP